MSLRLASAFFSFCLLSFCVSAQPGTAFTYQGQLTDGGNLAEGDFDFELSLWDAETSGTQVGAPLTPTLVSVTDGLLELELDFGVGAFDGEARWLEIAVRPSIARGSSFTALTPRRAILPTPQAQYALLADSAINDAIDDADADATNELNIALALNGTELALEDSGGSITVQLASLQDGTGTDDQTLTFVSPNLSIENGDTVDLSALQDGVDDADADPANEFNTGLVLDGMDLTVTDAGTSFTADLSPLAGSVFGDGHSLDAVDGAPVDALFVDAEGAVGIGTATPAEALTVDDGNILQTPGDPVLVGSLGIGGNPQSVYVSGRYAYVVDTGPNDLKVIDISDPSSPALTGALGIGDSPSSIYVSGRYAYVVDLASNDLKVIDISDPSSPALTGSLGIGPTPSSVYVSGRYAYVVDIDSNDLKVIDISDPSSPVLIGSLGIGNFPRSIYVSGRYAYVVDSVSHDLKVIDISDPSSPALIGSLGIGNTPQSVYVSGRYAYIVDQSSNELRVIDISDPSSPALTGSLGIGGIPNSVYVSGRYAYVVDSVSHDLKVIDISDPSSPALAGSLSIDEAPQSIYVSGRYAYVVDSVSHDLKVIDISGGEMTSLIAHSLEAGNLQVRNDVISQGQLQVSGGITAGSGGIYSAGDIATSGTVKAATFAGDGSGLTSIPGSTDDQTLSFTSPNLTIEDGNSVDLSSLVDDADADPANELQTLSGSDSAVTLSNGGGTVEVSALSAADGSPDDVALVENDGDFLVDTDTLFVDRSADAVGLGTTSPNERLEVNGRVVIRDPGNNGALILSPSTSGVFGEDPEFVIQSAEATTGANAAFHLSRNAIFQISDDTYQYIDDVGRVASSIQFEDDGIISFWDAPSATGQVTFTENLRIETDGGIFAPNMGTPAGNPSAPVAWDTVTGEIIAAVSSQQFKENIQPATLDAEKILGVEPVTYSYRAGGQVTLGYIAEQLHELGLTQLVIYDAEGEPFSVAYQLIPLFQNELIKKHEAEIESHEARLAEKDEEIEALRGEIQELRDLILQKTE